MKIILDANIDDFPANVATIPNYQHYLLNILVNIGYEPNHAPVADVLKKMHGLDGEWIIVTPINWQATHNDSMLTAAANDFILNQNQAEFVFTEFAKFVAEEGMQLFMHDAVTWLLKIDGKSLPNSKPVYSVLHRSFMAELSSLGEDLYWQKFITMSQMFLSSLQIPDDKNIYKINGVWIWGGGVLDTSKMVSIIALDEKSLQVGKFVTQNSHIYTPQLPLSKKTILIGSSLQSLQQLPEKYIEKINIWYWNNAAYKLLTNWHILKAIICRSNKKN